MSELDVSSNLLKYLQKPIWIYPNWIDGGGDEIRTHETVSRLHAFQASAINHSATPPQSDFYNRLILRVEADFMGRQFRLFSHENCILASFL